MGQPESGNLPPHPVCYKTSFSDLKVVSQRKACYLTEDDDALYLRVDMPGLGKEHTNIYPEDNYTLIVKGVGGGGQLGTQVER